MILCSRGSPPSLTRITSLLSLGGGATAPGGTREARLYSDVNAISPGPDCGDREAGLKAGDWLYGELKDEAGKDGRPKDGWPKEG